MQSDEIKLDNWHRIFIGNAPFEFLGEVLIRSIFLYLFLLVILRLMGKRMGGMLTISELAVMLTLGAIICVPMQIPDRGILQGFLVLTCALIFQRLFTLAGQYFNRAERITQGEEVIMVVDGVILQEAIKSTNISRQQLYAVLRSQGIHNLGAVERIYLEASGLFSVFLFAEPRAGLPLYPNKDSPTDNTQEFLACAQCGCIKEAVNNDNCGHCNGNDFTTAIK